MNSRSKKSFELYKFKLNAENSVTVVNDSNDNSKIIALYTKGD